MATQISAGGSANEELVGHIQRWWREAAEMAGIDLSGFNPEALLDDRTAWAVEQGLVIGSVYSRLSSKRQHSTDDQVRTCVQHAATKGIYCPPEFACVDEAQRGYRARRGGLDRMSLILDGGCASVLLVYNVSRLHRSADEGYRFIHDLVEQGVRVISVSQGIDTVKKKAWSIMYQVLAIVHAQETQIRTDRMRASKSRHARKSA